MNYSSCLNTLKKTKTDLIQIGILTISMKSYILIEKITQFLLYSFSQKYVTLTKVCQSSGIVIISLKMLFAVPLLYISQNV